MPDPEPQNQQTTPPPPPGFKPVEQGAQAVPPPPPGFKPVAAPASTAGTVTRRGPGGELTMDPNVLKEAGQGILGGALETTAGIGGLIQKIPVIGPKLIPEQGLKAESQVAEELQQTTSQKLGAGAETVGEFATMDAAVEKGLASAVKIAARNPEAVHLMETAPKYMKEILKHTMKGAITGGAEGGVRESRPGGEGTAEGIEKGAAGGAAGGFVASTAGEVIKPLGKAVGIGTTSEEDLVRALQPGKRNYRFLDNWDTAKDRIVKEVGEDGSFKDLGEAADRFQAVRQDLWNSEVKPAVARHVGEDLFPASALPVPTGTAPARNPVAEAIRNRIPKSNTVSQHSKQFNKAMEAKAKMFESPMKVGDAEELLERMNAELDVEGYWKKTPGERAAAEKVDPYIASRVAAGDELREQLYSHLEKAGEPNIKGLKKEYGAIASLEHDIRGRVNVADRQQPVSLKTAIGIGAGIAHGGPGGAAIASLPVVDKVFNNPKSLLNRAVSKATPAGPVKAAIQDIASGAATVAQKAAPAVGSIMFRGSDGLIHKVNEDQWEKVKEIDPNAKQLFGSGGKK